MKQYAYIFLFILSVQMLQAEEWHFAQANFMFENDVDIEEDSDYTQGSQVSVLMHRHNAANSRLQIPFTKSFARHSFISFAAGQQMYTPKDIKTDIPVDGARSYAGLIYMQSGLHQSSQHHLDSLSFKLGVVGPASYMEALQKSFHHLIEAPEPQGWNNQIGPRLGLQLDYMHKWRYVPSDFLGVESDFIPFADGELGTLSIKATTGAMWRVGYNIPHDFGASSIDEYGENGVPTEEELSYRHKSKWHYYLNFGAGASFVLYDVFLDAKAHNGEQAVEKYFFKAFGSYGATLTYDAFELTYVRTHYTKEYKTQNILNSYGSLLLAYKF